MTTKIQKGAHARSGGSTAMRRAGVSVALVSLASISTSCTKQGSGDLSSAMTSALLGSSNTSALTTPGSSSVAKDPFILDPANVYLSITGTGNTTMFLHAAGDFTKPCSITPSSSKQELFCILEAEELELYLSNLTIIGNFPTSSCQVVRYLPYYYYQFKPTVGPTSVEVNETGGKYTMVNAGDLTGGTTGAKIVSNSVHCREGDYTTDHDWKGSLGPNCCSGPYTLTIHHRDTNSTEITDRDWGGKPSNCLKGPAMDSQTIDANGYPKVTAIRALTSTTQAIGTSTVFYSPISKEALSNVGLSNYFEGATPPVATGSPDGRFKAANPYYYYYCDNNAGEHNYAIKLLVRNWSTDSEFKKANGDFKKFGKQGPPFSSDDLLEYYGWPGNQTEGSGIGEDQYPEFEN